LLRTTDIFEALSSEELETIAQLLRERRLAEAEVLCRQGDAGDALFIVTGGRIRLSTTDPSGNEKVLTFFTDGQFFGEMSLLTGAPRSASAGASATRRRCGASSHKRRSPACPPRAWRTSTVARSASTWWNTRLGFRFWWPARDPKRVRSSPRHTCARHWAR